MQAGWDLPSGTNNPLNEGVLCLACTIAAANTDGTDGEIVDASNLRVRRFVIVKLVRACVLSLEGDQLLREVQQVRVTQRGELVQR